MKNSRIPPIALLLTIVAFIPAQGPAKAQTTAPRRELRAAPAKSIKLDGRLDEAAWATAEAGSGFVQRFPDPGLPATMQTEVRVLYDADAIYVGARMFDPHPDSIAAPLARRDPGDVNSDWIDVIFDSYNDRRTAYRFGVNPAGTKLDVYHFDDSDDDNSWDAIWDVATRIDSLGWVAEYRIPLSQLRFHGSPGEQTWGLQFYRAVARRDEWTFWSPFTPTMPGFVSAMGILRGVTGIQPPAPLEVTPYFSSAMHSGNDAPGNPLVDRQSLVGAAGVDFRVGLGSALSLTGTVNPDFGQVEVDPAIINLSAVETFFPEKRPFFLEGAGIFQFGNLPVGAQFDFSRFVHWRRIGREPQLSPDARWTSVPDRTTILGAAKVSGQLAGGWSVGIADAVTERETARTISESGERGTHVVEPLTNYFVGRAKHDFGGGRSTFGVLATAANRSQDDVARQSLRDAGYLVGIDGVTATKDRSWTLGGFFVQSLVKGSAAAISATQRSSVRYLQRPDKDYSPFDPNRTELTGHDAALGFVYQGKPFFATGQVREITPGYEANDLGYVSRADVRTLTATFGGTRNTSRGLFRSSRVVGSTQHAWTFGGDRVYNRVSFSASSFLSSFWNVSMGGGWLPALYSDKHTRGGPLVKVPQQWKSNGSISSDGRRTIIGSLMGEYTAKAEGGGEGSVSTSVVYRPSSALEFSLAPTVSDVKNTAQYVTTVTDPLASSTFGHRYVFADLKQRTVSIDTRASWTLTPALSFQLFAQPFVSTARFDNYKELHAPGTFSFDVYGRDRGTISRTSNGVFAIDPDGNGVSAPFTIGGDGSNQSSFVTRALRVNAVVRWEYRGGSSIYLVWQQNRDAAAGIDDTYSGNELGRVLDAPSRNVLLLKASYRLGR